MEAVPLRTELVRAPLWTGNHVGIKQLAEYMARYHYLLRLRNENVVFAAVQKGIANLEWQTETLGYAEGWDEQPTRFQGFRAGTTIRLLADDPAVRIKPDAAAGQPAADCQAACAGTEAAPIWGGSATSVLAGPNGRGTAPTSTPGRTSTAAPTAPALRRFHGTVNVDPLRSGRDAAHIGEEIVQHLTSVVGAKVEITLEISAELAEGASSKIVRDVTGNCRTLKFTVFGLEGH